ncbi:hypothetical protein A2Z33_01260 [Candidatus Gottesmanbacteria bacterium RBG_16_52_11]|uniref:Probable transcriptional regulatory protein A2Z33_01260 n=1 Tax=Candidatus Gottesmanbacteria bacterium RBG_16_52_11 TaxID=1798374 RepID=A0A1F5YPP0_9BACT|nr:MAG: hypothetical protein A2Z33_01260 [Candidatus Gottesmanbacteria bacterium RBG_16_52_11]
MSGHSKWSKVKHQKAVTDVARAGAFTKASRAITVAVRNGGGQTDPQFNFRLRLAIEKAREVNMPKANIERAIDRGGVSGDSIEEVVYEAYGPGASALLIATLSDNQKRTVAAVKNTLEHHRGKLATPGSVQFQFVLSGLVVLDSGPVPFDRLFSLAVDGGADDVTQSGDAVEIYTSPDRLSALKDSLEKQGITVDSTRLVMKPRVMINLNDEDRRNLEVLIDELEKHEDVDTVYTNVPGM